MKIRGSLRQRNQYGLARKTAVVSDRTSVFLVSCGLVVKKCCHKRECVTISMDGRGRALDNIFVEQLWWNVKYEAAYLKGSVVGRAACRSWNLRRACAQHTASWAMPSSNKALNPAYALACNTPSNLARRVCGRIGVHNHRKII